VDFPAVETVVMEYQAILGAQRASMAMLPPIFKDSFNFTPFEIHH
jgi:hypothetical protein